MLNPSQNSEHAKYYNQERPSLVNLVRHAPNAILDLGCGSGAVGRRLLREGKAASIVGVEMFASASAEAAQFYTTVHTGDIEDMELPYARCFDYVLCGDILEHLKDPYRVVDRIRDWLKDDGQLICSLPNVRYWKVLAELAFCGAWDYQEAGIMDRTHLRFFTRRSCMKMLSDADFEVEHWRMLIGGRKYVLLNRLTFGVFEEFLGPQVMAVARKCSTATATPSYGIASGPERQSS